MFCFPHPTEEWTGLLAKSRKKKISNKCPMFTEMVRQLNMDANERRWEVLEGHFVYPPSTIFFGSFVVFVLFTFQLIVYFRCVHHIFTKKKLWSQYCVRYHWKCNFPMTRSVSAGLLVCMSQFLKVRLSYRSTSELK